MLAVGGGTTAAGLMGEYYNNLNLSGVPSFTRDDVRIDFDWRRTDGPGGSNSTNFSALGPNGFSIRWTGQIVPKFSETYTFTTATAGGVKLAIKPAGSPGWNQLIQDSVNHEELTADSGSIQLNAGQTYDLVVEYFASAGSPQARLTWSSNSTPSELIEPLSTSGYNFLPYDLPSSTFANAIKQGRDEWIPLNGATSVPLDSNGWPLSDAKNVVWEGQVASAMAGTYLLQFQGKAQVLVQMTGSFSVGGTNYGNTLPSGAGYDPATNTTTALYTTPGDAIMSLSFTKTQQKASSALNTGISNIHVMRPKFVGSTTSYDPNTLFTDTIKDALGRFTTIRYHTSVTANTEVNWSDRVLPGYFNAKHGFASMAWENLVMLSNELGKDMYIEIPMGATDDYITRLAKLIKYGSDGVNPYNSVQADPVYPPLNPNLRLYVEWSNEIWNSGYTQYSQGISLARDAVKNNTTEGQIINYDGGANWQRWSAVRTVTSSNIFRSVWGDAAMGNVVRVLLEYQPNNGQDTGSNALAFIDNYFNNADGVKHVSNPHPVSYYLWGAGSANYYGGGNERGYQSQIVFGDEGFESLAVAPGTVAVDPSGTPWNFNGNAGIVGPSPQSPTPSAPEGSQQIFIRPGGTVSQTIKFNSTGIFALDFMAAAPDQLLNSIDVYFDNQKINAQSFDPTSYITSSDPWFIGRGWGQNYRSYATYTSTPFRVATTGNHTISIVGRGGLNGEMDPKLVLYLDRIRIASLDAMYQGGIPYQSYPPYTSFQAQLDQQANFALAYGLHVVSYEGGWAMGGDFRASPLQNYAKYQDPRTKQANREVIDASTRAGGDLLVWGSYDLWEDIEKASSYPLVQAIDERNQLLPASNDNGMLIPSTLTNENMTIMKGGNRGYFYTTGITTWNVFVPKSGHYQFSASGGTSGGTYNLAIDGEIELGQSASNTTFTAAPYLTAGFHVVLLRNIKGIYNIPKITITATDLIPDPPTGLSATAASSTAINVGWTDQSSNETGFKVYRATDPSFSQGLTLVATTGGNVTSWRDTGLSAGATYYYRVSAFNDDGDSPFTTAASVATTPGAGSISGRVFSDTAGDARFDSTDPGLKGWTITVLDSAGKQVASTLTSYGGQYLVTGLSAGTYTVKPSLPTGWITTTSSKTYSVTIASGTSKTGVDFGAFLPVNVSGTVYNDLAGDRLLSRNDIGLSDWTVQLYDSSNKIVATAKTAADGSYGFPLVGPGQYTVKQVPKSGWSALVASNGYTFQASSAMNVRHADFGNFLPVTISGTVYRDNNGDGKKGSGENGLGNWDVNLVDSNLQVVATASTDSTGRYTFAKLGPGTFTLQTETQAGWAGTQPSTSFYSVSTISGTNRTGLNFGNFRLIQISGIVYNDKDGNGSRSSSDSGLSGWTVELHDARNAVIATAQTDKTGKYTFSGVGPGTWTIRQVIQPGWIQTQPTTTTYYTAVAKSGSNVAGQNFGVHQSTPLSPQAVVDNSTAGYTESGTWSTVSGGYAGQSRNASTVKTGDPTATAQWKFTGLGSTNTFDVYVTYRSNRGNSSKAPFTVLDSTTSLGTINVNQSMAVTMDQGLGQGSYGGLGWLKIGSFSIKSGVLIVTLNNRASGNYVSADGVLIVKQGATSSQNQSSSLETNTSAASSTTGLSSVASASGLSTAAGSNAGTAEMIGALPLFYGETTPGSTKRKGSTASSS